MTAEAILNLQELTTILLLLKLASCTKHLDVKHSFWQTKIVLDCVPSYRSTCITLRKLASSCFCGGAQASATAQMDFSSSSRTYKNPIIVRLVCLNVHEFSDHSLTEAIIRIS